MFKLTCSSWAFKILLKKKKMFASGLLREFEHAFCFV